MSIFLNRRKWTETAAEVGKNESPVALMKIKFGKARFGPFYILLLFSIQSGKSFLSFHREGGKSHEADHF